MAAALRSARDMHRKPLPEGGSSTEVEAHLLINHGRLLVNCPWCGSAEYADPTDHRFFCTECLNVPVKGTPLAVSWPDDFDRIEEALACRPDPRSRNWDHGDSLAKLEDENHEQGVR